MTLGMGMYVLVHMKRIREKEYRGLGGREYEKVLGLYRFGCRLFM